MGGRFVSSIRNSLSSLAKAVRSAGRLGRGASLPSSCLGLGSSWGTVGDPSPLLDPRTRVLSLDPACELGWDPPWELGVLELEDPPLLVLWSTVSMETSVLRRSGLLARMS